jgi:uncharacterized membrane protein YraQ (UPF0718 family)
MNALTEISLFVSKNVWHTLPLFVVSILLSVLIRHLKLDGLIRRAFTANVGKAILLATLVGAFSPFCSCTVIPIIAGLLISGVPLAPVMSFWIASPTMDPEVFTLSVGILGWPMALARLGATLTVSLAAGYVTHALGSLTWLRNILKQKRSATPAYALSSAAIAESSTSTGTEGSRIMSLGPSAVQSEPCLDDVCQEETNIASCGSEGCGAQGSSSTDWRAQIRDSFRRINWKEFRMEFLRQSWNLGRWILLAFLLEALITRYVPQAAIAGVLGQDNPLAVPLAALVGIPLYLNNFSALPIVSGLLAQGMQPGAAIAFLIAGPVTTVPAMTAVYGTVRQRIFLLYVGIALVGAVLAGLATNLILG